MDLSILLADRKWFLCAGSGATGDIHEIKQRFQQLNAILLNPMMPDKTAISVPEERLFNKI